MFETLVIILYFSLLALPVVGILVGLHYFPPFQMPEEQNGGDPH
jgi:hypothetical protein